MKKQEQNRKKKSHAVKDEELRIRNPKKTGKNSGRKNYSEDEEWDEYEEELARMRRQESLEEFFDDEEDD
ncbi:MAG: hypothetical protein C0599_05350 [Salinivirgaceae bacterium]|nr:MAG: hypothetical protein C0599_05350 [Salinivirgaceae bacterium]